MKKEFISFLSLLGFMVFSVGLFGQCQEAIALDHLPNGELLVCTSTPLPGNLNNGNVTIEYPDQVLGGTIPNYYYGGQEALYTYTPEADGPVSITVNNATWTAIWVFEGCPATGGTFVAGTRSTGSTRTVTFNAVGLTEYTIWIDTWPTPNSPCVNGGTWTITGPNVYVAPPPGGGNDTSSVSCLLVCSGNQTITLAPGACSYTLPNLVTMAGPCAPTLTTPAPVLGFTGNYSYANRYFHNVAKGSDPGYANLGCTNTSGMPNTLVLSSAAAIFGSNGCSWYGTVVAWEVVESGTISFDWSVVNDEPYWDAFGYSLVNDPNTPTGMYGTTLFSTTTILSESQYTQSGSTTINVSAGQIFSLVAFTRDGWYPYLTATINNFRFQGESVLTPWTINHVSGPQAGDELAPGTYTSCYELVDGAGVVQDDCCFDVTVNPYPNPSRTLACNDHVYISADENCQVTLDADMFLEGGPYRCYASYQIIIDGQNVPQGVALNIPLGNHTYEIFDPVTGNRCWGTFTVEDKLPPILDCNCVDEDVLTPFPVAGEIKGEIEDTLPLFERCNNNPAQIPMYYDDSQEFQATVSGTYTFTINTNWTTAYYIYEKGTFDPANPCNNVIASAQVTFVPFTFTANLNQGTTYVLVATTMWNYALYNGLYPLEFTINFTGPGDLLEVTNAADAPECQFSCYEYDVVSEETAAKLFDPRYKYKLTTPPTATDACGPANGTFTDEVVNDGMCGPKRILRHWTFTDAAGWTATCTQTFTFNPISVADLTPPAALVTLSCGEDTSPAAVAAFKDVDSRTGGPSANNVGAFYDDYGQTPSIIELQEGHPYGYFTYPHIGWDGEDHLQKVDPSVCNIYVSYTDVNIPACNIGCGGNMKVIRKWTLLDWCTGEVFEYTQVIKAVDDKAPTFDVKDVTISVNPWGCIADWNVENPWELQDNCSKESEIKWGVRAPFGSTLSGSQATGYVISGLKKGIYSITYWAEDCCGNYTEKVARLTVIDRSAPVAVAKQNIVLSLTSGSRPGDGTAKLYAWQVDNGSYDHCTGVKLEIRRIGSAVPSCGNVGNNGTNNNATFNHSPADNLPGVWAHPEDTRGSTVLDTDNGEFVMFCCEDIPANEIGAVHQVELRVWDDGNMNGIIGDNQDINGMRDNYNTTWADIRVENKYPPQIVCPPDVTVTCDMELNLSEGVDTPVDSVDLTMTGVPTIYDICGNQNATYRDVVRRGNCDNVTRVERTFKVTKGIGANAVTVQCRQIITVEWIEVPFEVTFGSNNGKEEWTECEFTLEDARTAVKKPVAKYGPCDIVGENIKIDTFLFEDGACKKWRVEYNYINWCTGEQRGPFVYYYYYKDNNAPSIVCPADQEFAATVDPANPNDGCLADVVLKASASDSLKCAAESWVKWQVFFDGWANGTVDRLASSFVDKTKYGRPAGQGAWFPVPRLVNGQLNPEWVRLQNAHPGVVLEDLVYVTYVIPSKASGEEITLPSFKLPNEQIWHKILWKVTDGCGNVAQCQSRVKAIDKKPPTPYCIHLSTALMAGNPKMVELWAKDFDKGAFDNCTPQSKLYFTFDGVAPIYTKITEEHYYKAGPNGDPVEATASEYANGRAYKWLPSVRSAGKIWTTAGEFDVKVSVWDEAWNTDFCDVDLRVIDNNQPGSRPVVSGTVATANGARVSDVSVTFDANMVEYPKTTTTTAQGTYSMSNYEGLNYEVNASKTGDYLNGVSTLDLVLIQNHLLGKSTLSDYNMIAADATNDGKVTAADLSEIRKLILGVTNEYSNNASWRFPVTGTPVSISPINYIEVISIEALSADVSGQDFVAVKIGDVNSSAKVNATSNSIETRSNDRVVLAVNEAEVEAGEAIAIPVTAEQYNNVAGFQYTMQLNGAEYVGIESGAIEMNASNVGNLGNGVVTMSYASTEPVSVSEGEVLFTIRAKAAKAMKVSEMMTLNSAVTAAESYNGNLEVGGVSLAVRTAPVASIELYQNEPNPFKGETTVSFMMPEAGVAKLSVYDMTGRQIVVRTIDAVKGLNSEVFTKAQLGVSGVLYYTLESGDYTATKKMIIVE